MNHFNKTILVLAFCNFSAWAAAQIVIGPQQVQQIFTAIQRADLKDDLRMRRDTTTSGTGSIATKKPVAQLSTQEIQWLDIDKKTLYTYQAQSPMFTGLYAPFRNFQAAPHRPTVMQFKNGSKIEIPKDAFVDKSGNPINSNIDIFYCEYKDAADQLLCGVLQRDMQRNIILENTGTYEIKFSQNGQEVFIHPDKQVKVQVASYKEEANFDFWKYEPITGDWLEIDGEGQIPAQPNDNYTQTDTSNNRHTAPTAIRHYYINKAGIYTWGRMRNTYQLYSLGNLAQINFDNRAGIKHPSEAKYFLLIDNGRTAIPLKYEEVQYFAFTNTADVLLAILPNNRIASFKGEYYKMLTDIIKAETAAQADNLQKLRTKQITQAEFDLANSQPKQKLEFDFDTENQAVQSIEIFKIILNKLTH